MTDPGRSWAQFQI
jgi:hypothetical protein